MGQALAEGLGAMEEFTIVALVDEHEPGERFGAAYLTSLTDVDPASVDVVVDFSSPEGVTASARWCESHGVALVVGTTGLGAAQREALASASRRVGVVVASNFSIGAVLEERFAAQAAPYFDRVEIVELHHDRKRDAPSGTSIATARAIAEARAAAGLGEAADPTSELGYDGARGAPVAGGVRVHSLRLEGLLAHQEVHFGGPGEGLVLRHDTTDRTAFMGGLLLALRRLEDLAPGVSVGLGQLV